MNGAAWHWAKRGKSSVFPDVRWPEPPAPESGALFSRLIWGRSGWNWLTPQFRGTHGLETKVSLYKLTMIEKLDMEKPGLMNDVCTWFMQGVIIRRVRELLIEKYGVTVPRWAVSKFRALRWVPQQRQLREKRLELLARLQVEQERAVSAELSRRFRGELR